MEILVEEFIFVNCMEEDLENRTFFGKKSIFVRIVWRKIGKIEFSVKNQFLCELCEEGLRIRGRIDFQLYDDSNINP